MNRRHFLTSTSAAGLALWLPRVQGGAVSGTKLLILVELRGGNDGLNTVIPYADPLYYTFRPTIAIQRAQVLPLARRVGLHPALAPLLPLWRLRQLAVVQGIGYAQANLSHYRSQEIWQTASHSEQYLRMGWLTRVFAQVPTVAGWGTDAMQFGSVEPGSFAQSGRVMVVPDQRGSVPAWIKDESVAAEGEVSRHLFNTRFPSGGFGASVQAAMQALAVNGREVAVFHLTLSGFDTHTNQLERHATRLQELAGGLVALQEALLELERWDDALVMTYSEFGRSVRENDSRGTEHGTAAPHFVMGGRVRGGLYGASPVLSRLDSEGNLPAAIDFRRLYATALGPWWGMDVAQVLQQHFEPLPLVRT